jgi:hypothetical protein
MSLDATAKHYNKAQPKEESLANIFLALRGRVKGGGHKEDTCHLIRISAETQCGLKPRIWVGRMIEAYKLKGVTSGWVFQDGQGASCGSTFIIQNLCLQFSAGHPSMQCGR